MKEIPTREEATNSPDKVEDATKIDFYGIPPIIRVRLRDNFHINPFELVPSYN
jgi:hypothetical protein